MKRTVLLFVLISITLSCGDRDSRKRDTGQSERTENRAAEQSGSESETPAGTDTGIESEASAGEEPGGLNHTVEPSSPGTATPDGAVLIASDIVTEVVVRPDPEGDPWESEKVAGYNGQAMVDDIFKHIYDGTMTVFDYHSGEPLSRADVKKIESDFNNDRSKIGKLSFTEDWYYYPATSRVEKKAKSVTFGYELYNNQGKVYAYRAAFRADLN